MVIGGIRNSMRLSFDKTAEEENTSSPSSVAKTVANTEDTVSFSSVARMLAERQTARQAESRHQDDSEGDGAEGRSDETAQQSTGPLGGLFDDFDASAFEAVGEALGGLLGGSRGGSSPGGTKKASQTNMEMLQRQIENARKELDKAQQALEKALAEARSDPAVVSEDDSGEVKEARTLVSETNDKLRQLQDQMNRAMREAYGLGPGGGGCIQGTDAGSTGVGQIRGHIGEATDPFAAARAAEQAELGGGQPAPAPTGAESAPAPEAAVPAA